MVLSDKDLKSMIEDKRVPLVDALNDISSIQPASIDLTLGREFILLDGSKEPVDIFDEDAITRFLVEKSFIIYPHRFVLATTKETVYIPPTHTAFIEGRSSIGRKGLFIHNAGYIDPGFKGQITLELYNASERPIKIHVGMRICQMVVCDLNTPASPYHGKYCNQYGVTPSRLSFKAR